jgi:hypothetical protein
MPHIGLPSYIRINDDIWVTVSKCCTTVSLHRSSPVRLCCWVGMPPHDLMINPNDRSVARIASRSGRRHSRAAPSPSTARALAWHAVTTIAPQNRRLSRRNYRGPDGPTKQDLKLGARRVDLGKRQAPFSGHTSAISSSDSRFSWRRGLCGAAAIRCSWGCRFDYGRSRRDRRQPLAAVRGIALVVAHLVGILRRGRGARAIRRVCPMMPCSGYPSAVDRRQSLRARSHDR